MVFNKFRVVVAFSVATGLFLLTGLVSADSRTDAIAERIAPVANVCMAGEECPTAAAQGAAPATGAAGSMAASSEPKTPEEIYNVSCVTCHAGALPNSPKLGSAEAWAPRIAKGMETLYESALNGTAGGMPPKGACMACSDDDIKATVDYMVEQSQ